MDTFFKDLAPHVIYELRAMVAAQQLYHADPDSRPGTFALEAFLIHVRCLHEFFTQDERKHPKNMYAWDYFASAAEWASHRPAPAVLTPDMVDRLHRRLAHLSRDRVTWASEEKAKPWEWPVDELADAILGYALAFVNALPSPRAGWFGGVLTVATAPTKPRLSKLLKGVTWVAAAVGLGSLGVIWYHRPQLPDHWLLQVAVFAAVATVPILLVEGFARVVVRLGKELRLSDHVVGFENPGAYLGLVERVLFLGALVAGYPSFIGVWFLFKGIAGWKPGGTDIQAGRRFQLFLLNNALSFAGTGLGWMVWNLLHLP